MEVWTWTQSLKDEYGEGMIQTPYERGLHRVALVMLAATFLLIFMGGMVTSHQAGLAVPDWPNSFGYNLFLLPTRYWVGGVLYEHTHRLMGTVVGMLAILLAVWAWCVESRLWVRWLGALIVLGVIVQGTLGGLRVVWSSLDLAMVHACVAQAFLCMVTLMVVATSRWWHEVESLSGRSPARSGRFLAGLAGFTAAAIYMQLIAGSIMRHNGAALAIPDFPWAYGRVLPPITQEDVHRANSIRALMLNLPPVTLEQMLYHYLHRVGACLVMVAVIALALEIMWRHRQRRELRWPAIWLTGLALMQFALGVMTVLMRKPPDVATAHVVLGAAVLAVSFVVMARSLRLYGPRPHTADQEKEPSPLPGMAGG